MYVLIQIQIHAVLCAQHSVTPLSMDWLVGNRNIKRDEAELRLSGSCWEGWSGFLPGSVWSVEDPGQDGGITPPTWGAPRWCPRGAGVGIGERMFWFSHPKNAAPTTLTSKNRGISLTKTWEFLFLNRYLGHNHSSGTIVAFSGQKPQKLYSFVRLIIWKYVNIIEKQVEL